MSETCSNTPCCFKPPSSHILHLPPFQVSFPATLLKSISTLLPFDLLIYLSQIQFSTQLLPETSFIKVLNDIYAANPGDLPRSPVVKNPPFKAGDSGSIPGQGTKIPHATGSPCARTPGPSYYSEGNSCPPREAQKSQLRAHTLQRRPSAAKIKIVKSKFDSLGTDCECAWETPPALSGNKGCFSHRSPAAWTVSPEGLRWKQPAHRQVSSPPPDLP